MKNLVIVLLASLLLPACSTVMVKEHSAAYDMLAHTPQDVEKRLQKSVGKKQLKKWDKHVSDDTVIVDLTVLDDSMKGTAR